MRRVLITGGFGYVGGRLAQSMAAVPGTEVVLGSRRARPVPAWLPAASTRVLCWDDAGVLRQACEGIDVVVHLASLNETDAAKDPAGALELSGVGTARLLDACGTAGVSRFVYFSTAHVYGSPLEGRIDERRCPAPIHPYATSHRAGEDAVSVGHRRGPTSGVVIRLSNSYGSPAHAGVDRWTLLVNDLCRQAVEQGRLVLRSAGTSQRDFVSLTDVARATEHLLSLPREVIGGEVFNVGGGESLTVFQMATRVAERAERLMGRRPPIAPQTTAAPEVVTTLDYRIDKLCDTGFVLVRDQDEQIDTTLRLCLETFAGRS